MTNDEIKAMFPRTLEVLEQKFWPADDALEKMAVTSESVGAICEAVTRMVIAADDVALAYYEDTKDTHKNRLEDIQGIGGEKIARWFKRGCTGNMMDAD